MKTTLGEMRVTYSMVHKEYNQKAYQLSVERNKIKDAIENTENGQALFGKKAATLDLQYAAVSEKLNEYNAFIEQNMQQWNQKYEEVATEENAKAAEDYYKNLGKIMTVIRRMCKGDIVPGSDEQKVMDYDKDVYMAAKNAQAIQQAMKKKLEKHESLWEDDEPREYKDPMEEADGVEVDVNAPEILSVDEVIAGATAATSSEAEVTVVADN